MSAVEVSPFPTDMSPTKPGHDWCCNACPFKTVSHDEATDHAVDSIKSSPFFHILYEREGGDLARPAKRRIVRGVTGMVETQVAPPKVERKKGRGRG